VSEVSVAMVVGALRDRAQRGLDGLARQTVPEALELVLVDVAPEGAPALRPPAGMPVVEVRLPEDTSLATARGAAVRHARAPVVAFLEDHCIPEPGWAAAVIEAHRQPCTAVGYAFTNANPGRWSSRAALLADYAPWAHPARDGPAVRLPGNNVAYKRDALLELGDGLDDLLVVDFNLHTELRRRGGALRTAANALVAHENFDDLRGLLAANHHYCRLMAINRARSQGWGPVRRLGFGLATPVLVPLLKLQRLAWELRGRRALWPGTALSLPVILVTYVWSAIGEARGYLGGDPGSADRDFTRWELSTPRDVS
jgi:hypothetical protein